jgi:integrase/recombinase XerC
MDWLYLFLDYLKYEKRFSPHTCIAYEADLLQYLNFLIPRQIEVKNARHQDIRLWIVEELEVGKSSRTVNRKISTLKAFYKFLIRNNYVQTDPTSKLIAPKQKKSLPVFVSEIEMNNLFENIVFPDTFEGIRDKTIIELFYATGIRLSELSNIKGKDIDFYIQTIKIIGNRKKERIVPFSPKLSSILKEYIAAYENEFDKLEQKAFLFVTKKGGAIYAQLIYKIVRKYLDLVTTVEKRSPHVIRHTFATHLLDNGADLSAIKEILGHSSLAATQFYTHTSVDKLKKTYKQAHPRA